MLYVIIGLGVMFLLLAFTLNQNNAKYLLAGYNTASKEDREAFDLDGFLPFFKKFHIFLGLSFLVLGLGAFFTLGGDAAGSFLGVYPIVAYIYFIWKAQKYGNPNKGINGKIGVFVLAITLIFVVGLLVMGMRENRLVVNQSGVEITGIYGDDWQKAEINEILLIEDLPTISSRLNGFALESASKGWFKTANGEKVKLILNTKRAPYIEMGLSDGSRVFYSSSDIPTEEIYAELSVAFPDLTRIE